MGYRGEDTSRTPPNWGREPSRQSSPVSGQGNAGSWTDGTQDNDDYDDYASGGVGYGQQSGGSYGAYSQQELGRGPEAQWPQAQGPEAQYSQRDAYGAQVPYGGPGGYDDPVGYDDADPADYGYRQPAGPAAGYGQQPGYDQENYSQPPETGYGPSGQQRYQAANDGSGPQGDYPPRHAGGSGAYPGQDAGNDWYGGQPAAASGASFADTGTYALNGRIIDEYGTGPREAQRTPARGYPPAPSQPQSPRQPQGRAQLPAPARPVVSGPQAVPHTGAQERYDDYDLPPGYGGEPPADRGGSGPGGDYPTAFRNPTGEYPAAVRNPSGSYPAAGRNPTGDYPTAVRNPSGGYPAAAGGDYDAYADGYGQDGSYNYAADADPYQERYGEGAGQRGAGKSDLGRAKKGTAKKGARPVGQGKPGRKRPLALAAVAVVAVVIAGAAAYAFLLNPSTPAKNSGSVGPLPTVGTQPSAQACVQEFGPYCHIESRTDDPTPLTLAELFPPVVNNETNGHVTSSFTLVTTKIDKTCSDAVIGSSLIAELKDGHCTQVARASYVSGDGKIMGTIGVINLETTTEAHYAGKVVDGDDFIAPLAASKGVAKKIGQGTGLVEAKFKGHYLILLWAEFVNGTTPSTTAEDNQLEQFSTELVAGTVNNSLSQRMVTGAAPTPGATA
jgi:hypothetical protein